MCITEESKLPCDFVSNITIVFCSFIQSLVVSDFTQNTEYLNFISDNHIRAYVIFGFTGISILIRVIKLVVACITTHQLYDDISEIRALFVTLTDGIFDSIQALSLLFLVEYAINSTFLIIIGTWLGVFEEILELLFKLIVEYCFDNVRCCQPKTPAIQRVQSHDNRKIISVYGSAAQEQATDKVKVEFAGYYGVVQAILIICEHFIGIYVVIISFGVTKIFNQLFTIIAVVLHLTAVLMVVVVYYVFRWYLIYGVEKKVEQINHAHVVEKNRFENDRNDDVQHVHERNNSDIPERYDIV